MNTERILKSTKQSLLIKEEGRLQDIIVRVPHHAPSGQHCLPCPEHKNSDENAGFIGACLAEQLDCCSVIACNYTIDVNKSLRSDYSRQIIAWNPTVLVEIHGHGKKKAVHDVEISCGSNRFTECSKLLAYKIRSKLKGNVEVSGVSICGCFNEIYYQAKKSLTITDERWLSYHIELSPQLRKPRHCPSVKPSAFAYKFCDYLAAALIDIHR